MITLSKLQNSSSCDGLVWYFFLILVSSSAVIISMAYPFASLIFFLFLTIFGLIYFKPMIGIYLFTLVYPIDSVFIQLNLSWPDYIRIYWFEVLSVILLMVMILRYLVRYHSQDSDSPIAKTYSDRWIIFFCIAFVFWSFFTVFWLDHLDRTLFGWFKFNCLFIFILFMAIYLDSYDKFVRLMTFYCCVSVMLAIAAIYSTYHIFLINYALLVTSYFSLSVQVSLFNQPGSAYTFLKGMIIGTGLSSKQELAMFLMGGVVFALFLIRHYKSIWIRCIFLLLILFFETVIYQGFVKLSILGSFIVLIFITITVSPWRKSMILVLTCFILLNVTAFTFSQILIPKHMKNREATGMKIKMESGGSEYQPSSFPLRLRYWESAIEKIRESHGLGDGPDSTNWDIRTTPNANNIVLTIVAEYGVPGIFFILAAFFFIARDNYYQIFKRVQVNNTVWLLKLSLVINTALALFQYNFDLFIWWPQLWFMVGLLWASLRLEPQTIK